MDNEKSVPSLMPVGSDTRTHNVVRGFVCWSLTSLCHSDGHIKKCGQREPFH